MMATTDPGIPQETVVMAAAEPVSVWQSLDPGRTSGEHVEDGIEYAMYTLNPSRRSPEIIM